MKQKKKKKKKKKKKRKLCTSFLFTAVHMTVLLSFSHLRIVSNFSG